MKGEIDRDWYCSCDREKMAEEGIAVDCLPFRDRFACEDCPARHRKWPIPEQFKEEYGHEYPDNALVYWLDKKDNSWRGTLYKLWKMCLHDKKQGPCVCACTPWGKPPDYWRPE